MAIVRKFTIGILPFAKSFRVAGLGGAAVDALLRLRGKSLPEPYFSDVGTNQERTAYRLTNDDSLNLLHLTEESITLTKDYYEARSSFDFSKVLEEFRIVWGGLDSVLKIHDIRRIGIVAEYRYEVESKNTSDWLRSKLLTFPTKGATEKFNLRFEERELAKDGGRPDPKKADFLNTIYSIYDSSSDANHPEAGFVDVDVDLQRYFTPLLNGNVGDEVLKLYKHFEPARNRIDDFLKKLGAAHAKK